MPDQGDERKPKYEPPCVNTNLEMVFGVNCFLQTKYLLKTLVSGK